MASPFFSSKFHKGSWLFCSSLFGFIAFTWLYGHLGFYSSLHRFIAHIGFWVLVLPFNFIEGHNIIFIEGHAIIGSWVSVFPFLRFIAQIGSWFLFFPSYFHCIYMGIRVFGFCSSLSQIHFSDRVLVSVLPFILSLHLHGYMGRWILDFCLSLSQIYC